jgi:uncharacterized protein YpbB
LYHLYPYYRRFPRISKEEWEKIVSTLLQDGFVTRLAEAGTNGKTSFAVTERGRRQAQQWQSHYQLSQWLAPFTESGMAAKIELFWQRLHLVVQTVSQLLAGDLGFLPAVSDKKIQQWVKAQLAGPLERTRWKQQLAEELYLLWAPLPKEVQAVLAGQLSGAAQVGKTLSQLAMQRREEAAYLHVLFRYGVAHSIRRLQGEAESFPLLSRLVVADDRLDPRLTESAARTYALIQRGWGVEQIASACPEWDCSSYLEPKLAASIIQTSERLQTSRLRLIKDHLGASVSYLQIRLALARRQGEGGA